MKQRERERKSKKICEERRQTHRFYTQESLPCVGKRLFLAGLQGKVMEGRLVWNGCEKIYMITCLIRISPIFIAHEYTRRMSMDE